MKRRCWTVTSYINLFILLFCFLNHQLVTAYRTVQRDKEKTQVISPKYCVLMLTQETWHPGLIKFHFRFCCSSQAILSQSQDKALRRIGELREVLQSLLNVAVAWGENMNFLSEHMESDL